MAEFNRIYSDVSQLLKVIEGAMPATQEMLSRTERRLCVIGKRVQSDVLGLGGNVFDFVALDRSRPWRSLYLLRDVFEWSLARAEGSIVAAYAETARSALRRLRYINYGMVEDYRKSLERGG